jgi:hypothetical protein
MKKLLIASLMTVGLVANANAWHQNGHYGYGGGWVAPAMIGGVIGYTLSQPRVIVQQPPVIYTQQPQVIVQQPQQYQRCEQRVMIDQYGQQQTGMFCYQSSVQGQWNQ